MLRSCKYLWRHVHAKKADELITKHIQDMELLVKILSIGELREIPLTQTDGSVKLLAKREFEITNGSATMVAEMVGDAAKAFAHVDTNYTLWQAEVNFRVSQGKEPGARKFNNIQIVSLKPFV